MSKEAVSAFSEDLAKNPAQQKELAELAARHRNEFTSDEFNGADLSGISGRALTAPTGIPMNLKKTPGKT